MDANGTCYHLLLGYTDWARCLDENGDPLSKAWESSHPEDSRLAWNGEGSLVRLGAQLFRYIASPQDTPPTIDDRRGAACDRYGNWYWIDPSQYKIRVFWAGAVKAEDYWPVDEPACPPKPRSVFIPTQPPPAQPILKFAGLAVTEEHYLVVGVLNQPGLLVFDLHAGGPPEQLTWPNDIPFVPFDIAPMPGGGVWILDRDHACYWALNRNFDVLSRDQAQVVVDEGLPENFQPLHPGQGKQRSRRKLTFPTGISLEDASPLDTPSAVAIEGLPDCTVLVLSQPPGADFSEVSRYRFGRRLGLAASLEVMKDHIEEDQQAGFTLVGHDFAFVPEHTGPDGLLLDRLYVASSGGNQVFAFNISGDDASLNLTPLPEEYLPMRLYTGKALETCAQTVYYDLGERWLPLVEQRHPRYFPEGSLTTRFDSRLPGCTWHRLMLDACIPPDCAVVVESRAADLEADLDSLPWNVERLYLRGDGSELPFVPNPFQSPAQSGDSQPKPAEGGGTWELLFQRTVGQHIELRLTLRGQGQRTPRLRALRLYYPRFSYLAHYLPAVYRQEPDSASFLERFMANLEGFSTAAEDKIAAVRLLFDVNSAPQEALEWLAGWLGASLDPAWDDYRRRLFIGNALTLFQYRGTPHGLRMILRLALETCPTAEVFAEPGVSTPRPGSLRIVETFRTRSLSGAILGDPTRTLSTGSVFSPGTWQPSDGPAILNLLYQKVDPQASIYPLQDPGGDLSSAWRQFSIDNLGFTPSATPDVDTPLWRAFLAQNYATVDDYNKAYGLGQSKGLTSFNLAELPDGLPSGEIALDDWYRFETKLLPVARSAHHFSVLLPLPAEAVPASEEYQSRLGLARRILDLEKPAHTTYTIKFFWALFRLGDVRLGQDTLLDEGSRSPHFIPDLVLGSGHLSESTLGARPPYDLTGRLVLKPPCEPVTQTISSKPAAPTTRRRPVSLPGPDCWSRMRGA